MAGGSSCSLQHRSPCTRQGLEPGRVVRIGHHVHRAAFRGGVHWATKATITTTVIAFQASAGQ